MGGPSKGLTLVEILISLGLLSILGLVISTVLVQTSQNSVTARGKAGITADLAVFGNTIENLLANTTRIRTCACGTNCRFDSMTPTYGSIMVPSTTLLDWESETAADPSVLPQPGGACLVYGAATNPETTGITTSGAEAGIYLRGCKQRFRLSVVSPTANTTAGTDQVIGTPGVLRIESLAQDGSVQSTFMQLEGLTSVQCGMSDSPGGTQGDYASFHLDIRAKTRANLLARTSGGRNPESWMPTDGNPFLEGVHRQLSFSVQFREFNMRGIHFGLTESFMDCEEDGSTTISNCCSGYHNGTACIAASACLVAGAAIAGSSEEACCSKTESGGTCW